MTTHLTESQLHDIVDGAVAAAQMNALEPHLAVCAECAGRVHALRTLRAELRALPRSIEPPVDLLPGIRARIRAPQIAPAARSYRWPVLAAAAIVLCALSSAITLLIVRTMSDAPTVMSQRQPAGGAVLAQLVELRATEARYVDAIDELRAALREHGVLEPETVRLLEHSLATIDRALADARAALAADPGNPLLAEMLHANYESKLDLLRRAGTHARARL